jgi:hypothetical protein
MIGKTYLEHGKPVVVLVRWGKGGGPRNVLIQREHRTKVVRPFRALRNARKARGVKQPVVERSPRQTMCWRRPSDPWDADLLIE